MFALVSAEWKESVRGRVVIPWGHESFVLEGWRAFNDSAKIGLALYQTEIEGGEYNYHHQQDQ